mmetsp:Transcript_15523/g.26217  ORF Transcript_15523/g.26217 Transcript_15523/m.26217 type:complete len:316 (+) Transcript_15523:33-980(+)
MRAIITTSVIFIAAVSICTAQQRSDPTKFNGGSILAMAGRNSVAIAIDSRFGLGMQTISTAAPSSSNDDDADNSNNNGNPRILLFPNSNTLLAWTGLYGDGLGFSDEMSVLLASKVRRAGGMRFDGTTTRKTMNPKAIAMLMSHLLYRRRNAPYYVEPVIVGLETVLVEEDCLVEMETVKSLQSIAATTTTNEVESAPLSVSITPDTKIQCKTKTIQRPYLMYSDMLGAQSTSHSFVCSGVASRSLHGTAEALWRPNLEGEELVEICGRAFVSALERDCYSGYGAVVYLIQATENDDGNESDVCIVEYVLSSRND